MNLKTRYCVGDNVYLMFNNKIVKRKIARVDVGAYFDPILKDVKVTILYTIHDQGVFHEELLFFSKEELVQFLMQSELAV